MESIDRNAIRSGIIVGLGRARENLRGFEEPESLRTEIEELVVAALQRVDLPSPPWRRRGFAICAELSAMAAAARIRYREPKLSLEDILVFVEPLGRFVNSWVHE